LLGHTELRQLCQWTYRSIYALAKQRGNTITFCGIDVIEVCRDSFLDIC